MPIPIAIDHPDGRTRAAYKAFGAEGYPCYPLFDREGRLLYSDNALIGPTLRVHNLEIIRALVMGDGSGSGKRWRPRRLIGGKFRF
jgi:hypothetical protein